MVEPNQLAQQTSWKIPVTTTGWYEIKGNQLVAAGMMNNTDPDYIKLYRDGVEIPMAAYLADDSILDTNDSFYFFGTPHTGEMWDRSRIYWLTIGTDTGLRMSSRSASPIGQADAADQTIAAQVELETVEAPEAEKHKLAFWINA